MIVSCGITSPCKDCTERNATCHSVCDKYKQYKLDVAESKKKGKELMDQVDFDRDEKRAFIRKARQLKKWGCY